jgi:hypothetical protein
VHSLRKIGLELISAVTRGELSVLFPVHEFSSRPMVSTAWWVDATEALGQDRRARRTLGSRRGGVGSESQPNGVISVSIASAALAGGASSASARTIVSSAVPAARAVC